MNEIEYYYDNDTYVASIDRGSNGFFVRHGTDPAVRWDFVVPGSTRWDSLHQNIYYAHHDYDFCPQETVDTLPAVPPVPDFERIKWEDNFIPQEKFFIKDYPYLVKKLTENKGAMTFWFVLNEDLYETLYGDGEFHYFYGEVYISKKKAKARLDKEEEESKTRESPYTNRMSIVLKDFRLTIQKGEIIPSNFLPEVCEHYEIEKVIDRIEEILASENDTGWGKRNDRIE